MEQKSQFTAYDVASYLCYLHRQATSEMMGEMMLHKLLYFSQQEKLIQTGKPLFDDAFAAWKFGPVCPSIREPYQKGEFDMDRALIEFEVANKVYNKYAHWGEWSLAMISRGQKAYKKARGALPDETNGDGCPEIPLADIRADARAIAELRQIMNDTNATPIEEQEK